MGLHFTIGFIWNKTVQDISFSRSKGVSEKGKLCEAVRPILKNYYYPSGLQKMPVK